MQHRYHLRRHAMITTHIHHHVMIHTQDIAMKEETRIMIVAMITCMLMQEGMIIHHLDIQSALHRNNQQGILIQG